MTLGRRRLCGGLGVLVLMLAGLGLSVQGVARPYGKTGKKVVMYSRIATDQYQNFIGNWDAASQPLLYAQIQTPAQYETLFHAAPAKGAKRSLGPDATLFDKEQILVVARVVPASAEPDQVFGVERVTVKDDHLELAYRFAAPDAKAGPMVKDFLAIRIARRHYRTVSFVENGRPMGTLDAARGQWSVPEMAPVR